jgi:hypothetical protein
MRRTRHPLHRAGNPDCGEPGICRTTFTWGSVPQADVVLPITRDTLSAINGRSTGRAAMNGHSDGRVRRPPPPSPAFQSRDGPHSVLKHHKPNGSSCGARIPSRGRWGAGAGLWQPAQAGLVAECAKRKQDCSGAVSPTRRCQSMSALFSKTALKKEPAVNRGFDRRSPAGYTELAWEGNFPWIWCP